LIDKYFHLIGEEITLSPGHYRYNFQAALPAQLPTSCEAPYGAIRYLLSVVLGIYSITFFAAAK
jgi:hypothetical protein